MAIDTMSPRSRRAVLAAATGGLAALVAHALGRPPGAAAADGDAVQVGGTYSGQTRTKLSNSRGSGTFLQCTAIWGSSHASGAGVYGTAESGVGVAGWGNTGPGVSGTSESVAGVQGFGGTDGPGIYGISWSTTQAGAVGQSYVNATGVIGQSNSTFSDPPVAPAKTGVYGLAVQDAWSRGVTGQSASGRGVSGVATSGRGVHGFASTGVGGYFASGASGRALQAAGRVEFSTSGIGMIAAGTKSKRVTPAIDLTADSRVLVTLLGHPGGSTVLQRVAVDAAADSFIVHLTASATAVTPFAWFVIG